MTKTSSVNLRIPGPTPLPPEVLKATSRQMINHRAHHYEEMQARILTNLKHFFQTENEIYLLTASGMGGLEAAVVNFFSPGDRILSFTCGEFGNRWADVARAYGADVFQTKFPPHTGVDKDEFAKVLESQKGIKGVFITHNETSSGVLNDINELAPLVHDHPDKPLLLIDSISALGAVNLPMDSWGVDVLVTASQKGWMAPPGLSMIAVSEKAWEFYKLSKMPRYYWDLSMYKKFNEKNQTPATPAVSALYGLDASLQLMLREGRNNIYNRHLEIMDSARRGLEELGLQLFVSEKYASPTVTSFVIPQDIDGHELLQTLREKHHVVLAGGMGETKGKIIRIAHMGYVSKKDIDGVLSALHATLK